MSNIVYFYYVLYSDRLSAQDILTVKKVTDYLYGKLYEGKKDETTDTIEIYCQGQVCVTIYKAI